MAVASVAQALGSIEGLWTTFDDDSNARRATVEITPAAGEWIGRVVEVFAAPDEDTNPRCAACSGADRNRLIVGMDILHVRSSDGAYSGSILDPESGVVYRCIVEPSPDGKSLRVRGYVGLPLLGRVVTWIRAPATSMPPRRPADG